MHVVMRLGRRRSGTVKGTVRARSASGLKVCFSRWERTSAFAKLGRGNAARVCQMIGGYEAPRRAVVYAASASTR